MLSCAGLYVSGAAGSNACPAGSVRIETEAACRAAITAKGSWTLVEVEDRGDYPRGCYSSYYSDNAYFNTHAVGAGHPGRQPLCAGTVITGARA